MSDRAQPLTVETAAVRIGETVFTLPRPNRHHNIIWALSVLGIESNAMHDHGFVLSNGQYACRTLAAKLALSNGQVKELSGPPNLFSEDLWDGPSPGLPQLAAQPHVPAVGGETGADAVRYRYLREHRSHQYIEGGPTPCPAEWGISWDYQQTRPGEQFMSIDALIDEDIAALDDEARAALSTPPTPLATLDGVSGTEISDES